MSTLICRRKPPVQSIRHRTPATPLRRSATTPTLAAEIELRWQDRWEAEHVFETPNPAGSLADPDQPWPPPARSCSSSTCSRTRRTTGCTSAIRSGSSAPTCIARYQRMAGRNVLYTMGFDAFGLPAEQFAVQTGQHPAVTTADERRQLPQAAAPAGDEPRPAALRRDDRPAVLPLDAVDLRPHLRLVVRPRRHRPPTAAPAGRGRSPSSSPSTRRDAGRRLTGGPWSSLTAAERAAIIDPQRLAYVAEAPVNWCPGLGTVVANEEVTADGRSDRGNFPVFKRTMRQWMMRITAYADRLLDDLDRLDWTDALKTMQRNWIGRSTGARIDFDSPAGPISVFTTRPDTLFGATFMVLAPEHPLVPDLTTREQAIEVVAVPQGGGSRAGDRAPRRGPREDRRVHRFVRHQPGDRRGHPDLDRRLRADGLRHRGDHGRAVRRPARLRVRQRLRPRHPADPAAARRVVRRPPHQADPRHPPLAGGVRRRRPVRQLVEPRGVARRHRVGRRRHRHDQRVVGVPRRRRGDDHLQAARLAVRPAALLGRADPDRLRRRRRPPRAARRDAAADAARHRSVLAAVVRPRRRVLRAGEPARPGHRLGGRDARPRRRRTGATAATPT